MHLEGTHVSLADDFEAVVDVENISGSNATHLTGQSVVNQYKTSYRSILWHWSERINNE